MSKATKRKYVTQEVLEEFALPDEEQKRFVMQIVASRGNNLHEARLPDGETFLISMPTKFRKNVWIKRGDFVLAESIEEGDKVRAEISHILYKEQIKYIKEEGKWPKEFSASEQGNSDQIPADMLPPSDSDSDDDDDDEGLACNPNRQVVTYSESEEEDSD